MFDIFKKDIKIGDKVKLYLTTGKEPVGIVSEIGDSFVLLKSEDNISNRFFDKLIGGWDVIISSEVRPIKRSENSLTQGYRNPIDNSSVINKQFIIERANFLHSVLSQSILKKSIEPNANIIEVRGTTCIAANGKFPNILIPNNRILDERLILGIESFERGSIIPVIVCSTTNRSGKTFVTAVVLPQTIESFLRKFTLFIKENKFNEASHLLDIFRSEMGLNKAIGQIINEIKKIRQVREVKEIRKVELIEKENPQDKKSFKLIEKEINDLIRQSFFEKALIRIELELEKNTLDDKYVSSLLLKKAQIFSSLDKPEDSEIAYQQIIKFNEKINSPKNNLSHLYTELARLQSLKNEKNQVAIISIRRALELNPSNTFASNLLRQLERKVDSKDILVRSKIGASNDHLVIDSPDENLAISKLINVDVIEHKFTHPEILKNGGKSTAYIATQILEEARKTKNVDSSEKYPIYLEAAKAFSELNVGSYTLTDYQEAVAYYSMLKGNSLFVAFRQSVLSGDYTLTSLTRLKDSSSSYYLEALNLLANITPKSLLIILANYLKLNIVNYYLRKGQKADFAIIFKGSFVDIFGTCLRNQNIEIEEIAYRTIVDIGASSINAWNSLYSEPKGAAILFDSEKRMLSTFQAINRIESSKLDIKLRPSLFLRAAFLNRRKKKDAIIAVGISIQKIPFDPSNFTILKQEWNKLLTENQLFTETDLESRNEIDKLIAIIQPYLNRTPNERTNILFQARSVAEKQIKFINDNTTSFGRSLFYDLLIKWKKEIDGLLEEKIAQSFPSLKIIVDPPYYITTDGKKSIPIIIKNEGETTSEGFSLNIYLESTVYESKANAFYASLVEVAAGSQVETSIALSDKLLNDSNAVELIVEVQAIYQSRKLPSKKFQFTVESEPVSSLTYDEIPWRDGPIPSKDLFKGRKRLVADLAQHYLSIDRDKPYILYGLTRTGKSSVLEYLKKNIEGNTFFSKGESYKIITFSWELNEAASQANASDFYYYILYQQTYEVLEAYCTKNNLVFDGFKIDEKKVRFRDFKIILDFLAEHRIFPLFLIDEFSFIKNLIDKGTIDSAFLHSLRQFSLKGFASFIFAGTYDIKLLIKNPQYGITGQLVNAIEYQVNEISDEAAEELIEVIAEKLSFTPEAIDHIKFLSGKIPYFIQIICKYCGYYAVENNRRYIGYPELEKVVRILIGQDPSVLNSFVKKLSEGTFQNNQFSPADPKEVSVLISSIAYFNRSELKPRGVGFHELEKLWADKKLGSYKQKLAESINILLEKKILIQEEDECLPVYKLAVDLFRRWWSNHHPDINLILTTLIES